ncbi:MAG: hypothetical protein CM15mP77_2320 [Synechococcus sp.]|nr:MAG: hypothetical protein CM15mP77_2320 [Synechococcus sp.]
MDQASSQPSPVPSVAHLKPIITGYRQLAQLNRSTCAPGGPCSHQARSSEIARRRPFGLHFNTAVRRLRTQPRNPRSSAADCSWLENQPLEPVHGSAAPALQEGLQPAGLGSVDEPPGYGIGSAASASRHREQIIEELAQCR